MKMIGIYAIVHALSGKAYVGQSIDIMRRLMGHKRALKKGNHHCIQLQRAWNKYGQDQFQCKIMLLCSKDSLNFYEELVFKAYELYNSQLIAGTGHYTRPKGLKHSLETKEKIRASTKGLSRPMTKETAQKISAAVRKARNCKPIILLDETGKSLRFDTMKDVSRYLDVSLQTVWNCLNGRQMRTKGCELRFC